MKEIVNRKQRPIYNRIRLEAMQRFYAEADRIAAMLLAVCYSAHRSPSSQKLIQMDCIAATFVGSEIWVASNHIQITADDINEALGEEYEGHTVYVIKNGRGNMHAEMQLVQELRGYIKGSQKFYIGTSKPCCKKCADVLDNLGFGYLQRHYDNVENWEQPSLY